MENMIKELEYRLVAAQADVEVAQEVYHTIASKLREAIKTCVTRCMCQATGSEVLRAWHRYDHFDNEFNLMFEVGFYNEKEDRIDFGSDISFYFSIGKGLTMNHGTIGTYGKDNIYQFKRMQLMGYIANNIVAIEKALEEVVQEYSYQMAKAENDESSAQSAVNSINLGIEKIKRSMIEENIGVGTILSYDKECAVLRRLFYIPCVEEWVVKKITPKRIYVFPNDPNINMENSTRCINRNDLITHIFNDACKIKE